MPKTLALLMVILFSFVMSASIAQEKPNTAGLEPWEAWQKWSPYMNKISRQLGVTCNHCHNTKNYRESNSPKWQQAKKHIEMVDMLNEKFSSSFKEKVDCYMCHRGKAIPDYKEKLN